MAMVTAELYWLRMLLKDLRIPLPCPPILRCNNLGALSLATNPVFHARTKHVEVDNHFTREKVVRRDILLKFISTSAQLAELFSKGLTSARFHLLSSRLMIRDLPISLHGHVKDKDEFASNSISRRSSQVIFT